ncbi:MAG TPA: septal ring lytic transglycosylase RlpA family protein [Rhodocyclaceae bacterium]|nr:septal ring lytic transglycosylase RlpA family protein [Rhodocyclaceae bacterium]
MPTISRLVSWVLAALLSGYLGSATAAENDHGPRAAKPHHKGHRQVKRQVGKASYYSRQFAGKKMADGTRMNPNSNVAASKTLPLGTKAEVTNLETGKSTVVEIRDRGPYVDGRVIDLSPKAAEKIDMKKEGVAPVEVTPIEIPAPRGSPAEER